MSARGLDGELAVNNGMVWYGTGTSTGTTPYKYGIVRYGRVNRAYILYNK